MSGADVPLALELTPRALRVRWAVKEDTGTLVAPDAPDALDALDARILRAGCRCASCQAARLRGEPHAPADDVRLVDAVPVGHYALQLVFSDGHARGIYPWSHLRALQRAADAAA